MPHKPEPGRRQAVAHPGAFRDVSTRRLLRRRTVRALRTLYGLNRSQARLVAYKPRSSQAVALLAAITDAVNEAKAKREEAAA